MVLHDNTSLTTCPFADAFHPRSIVVQVRRFEQKRRQPRVWLVVDRVRSRWQHPLSQLTLSYSTTWLEFSRQLAHLASLAQNLSEFLVVDGGKDHRERVKSRPNSEVQAKLLRTTSSLLQLRDSLLRHNLHCNYCATTVQLLTGMGAPRPHAYLCESVSLRR